MGRLIHLRPLTFILMLLMVWQLAVSRQQVHLLPSPVQVAGGFIELAWRGLLVKDTVASLFRVTWGYSLAALIAIPGGVLLAGTGAQRWP